MTAEMVDSYLEVQQTELAAPPSGGLLQLIERLNRYSSLPDIANLQSALADADITKQDLAPYWQFKAGTYARHRLLRSPYLELLLLCWRPGQRTPIHDHNGSVGVVRVLEGVLWETLFVLDEARALRYHCAREWRPDGVTMAEAADIHLLGNPEMSGLDLVTLHIYSPPLTVLHTYKVGSTQVDDYCADQYIDGAGI